MTALGPRRQRAIGRSLLAALLTDDALRQTRHGGMPVIDNLSAPGRRPSRRGASGK
jgi:hypothetical protein